MTSIERSKKQTAAKAELSVIRERLEVLEGEALGELADGFRETISSLYNLQGFAEVLDSLREFRPKAKR